MLRVQPASATALGQYRARILTRTDASHESHITGEFCHESAAAAAAVAALEGAGTHLVAG